VASETGLVLSGGGMRGAYEVGVVAGMMEVLGRTPAQPPLFRIFSGTSVGAINCTFFASRAHQGDHGISHLVQMWKSLRLGDHLALRPLGLLRTPKVALGLMPPLRPGRSMLDASRIESTVRNAIDFPRLHENVADGNVQALLIAALHIVSGRTTVFAEVAPGHAFSHSRGSGRIAYQERITIDHVLASAALPLLFPTRRVRGRFYCDGGLRFNTPIAPALRAGAKKLVVIAVGHQASPEEQLKKELSVDETEARDISAPFLVGKLLNALLLDPVQYDLQILERLNQIVEVLGEALSPEEHERFQEVLMQTRGAGYRKIETLVFRPSQDLGQLAGRFLRTSLDNLELGRVPKAILKRMAGEGLGREADWASYMLFDGTFATELIQLGRRDALDKSAAIKALLSE
jgi:NTE family protein